MEAAAASSTEALTSEPSSTFDLEAYISNYAGVSRLRRLAFIAYHCPALKQNALRLAVDEVKRTTSNTKMYNELISHGGEEMLQGRDDSWVELTDKRAAQTLEKLESGLTAQKTSLVKESIRMGYNDLGDFHQTRGEYQTALKCYMRTRDYCTTSKHTVRMCLHVIEVSIHMGNFAHVANYVTKAESSPEVSDPILTAQLRVASGLSHLESKKYKLAARKFLETNPELGNGFNSILSAQDIALYGGLCALASFDRAELKAKLIDNTGFRGYLELFPEVRELIYDFYNSKYASCLEYLRKLKPDLLLDLHLHSHVETLYQDIRSKALMQYFSPFTTVDMKLMASAFNSSLPELEKELAKLIIAGQIPARIDAQNKILYARRTDDRSATFEKALGMAEDYMRDTKALLLRINMLKNDFVLKGNGDQGPSKTSRQPGDRMERSALSGDSGIGM